MYINIQCTVAMTCLKVQLRSLNQISIQGQHAYIKCQIQEDAIAYYMFSLDASAGKMHSQCYMLQLSISGKHILSVLCLTYVSVQGSYIRNVACVADQVPMQRRFIPSKACLSQVSIYWGRYLFSATCLNQEQPCSYHKKQLNLGNARPVNFPGFTRRLKFLYRSPAFTYPNHILISHFLSTFATFLKIAKTVQGIFE